jgi:hypothetical protein
MSVTLNTFGLCPLLIVHLYVAKSSLVTVLKIRYSPIIRPSSLQIKVKSSTVRYIITERILKSNLFLGVGGGKAVLQKSVVG